MWRSDVIKIAGKSKTKSEVKSRLNYQQDLDINGSKIVIMGASERALSLGSSKVLEKVSKKLKQLTLLKIFEQSTSQSPVSKDLSMQSNEDLHRMIQEIVDARIQAKLQSDTSVQLPP